MPVEDVISAVADRKSRLSKIDLHSDYYRGQHRIGQFASAAFRREFEWVLINSRENLCKAVVRGFSSKLKINTLESNTGSNAEVAGEMADILGMKRVYNLTHRETYKTGDAYVLVWPDAAGVNRAWPKMSRQMAVKTAPGLPDVLLWAAMIWITDDGYGRVNVYDDKVCERWITSAKLREPSATATDFVTWPDKVTGYRPFGDDTEGETITHKFGRVPVVWFPHDSDEMGSYGNSILEDVVPLQDGLNKSVADLIVAGENFAQPLRYLMNYRAKRTIDPETGEPREEKIVANPSKNKFLTVPGDGPIGQLDPPDASNLTKLHAEWASKIGRVVGLPAFYLTNITGEPPTGRALRVMSTRQTDLVLETMDDFDPRWSQVWALLGVEDVRPVWKDPTPFDPSEILDMGESRKAIGFGLHENLKEMGYDDDDAKRIVDDAQQNQSVNGGAIAARAFEAGIPPGDLVG